MDGHIFTTLGWLPADQVELRESVTHDDERIRMVRIDKYVDGAWVGNDLVGHIKTGFEMSVEQAVLAPN